MAVAERQGLQVHHRHETVDAVMFRPRLAVSTDDAEPDHVGQ